MRFLVALALLLTLPAFAKWTDTVRSRLPSNIQKLELGKTDRAAARKLMGAPQLTKGDKDYWIVDGFKYAVELSFEKNTLKRIHYNFPKKTMDLEELKKDIDPKKLKASSTSPHTILVYEDKDGKLEIELTSGKIESVRFQ